MKFKPIVCDVSAFISGVTMVYAFAPYKLWGLSILSLSTFLMILYHTSSIKRASFRGALYGLGFYGVGSYWQFVFISTFPSKYQWIMYIILGGIVFILICFPAIYSALLVGLKKLTEVLWLVILFPFIWLIGEWIRTWLWTGFPYYQVSYAFTETPLAGYGPVGGELLITLAVTLSATGLLSLFLVKRMSARISILGILAILWVTGEQLKSLSWNMISEKPIEVRLIHGMPNQEKKFRRYYVIDTIKEYLEFSKAEPKPNLVIWPESSVAIDIKEVYRYLGEESKKLEASGTSIVLGTYRNMDGHTFNTFLQASNLQNYYTKRHLIPFGEYTPDWPLIDLTQLLPERDMDSITEGQYSQSLISVAGIKLATNICYEIIFGNEFREDWKEANVLVYISDLSWFIETWGADQLLQIAQMRAIESGKPLLTSTNHGITAIVDNHGEILKHTEKKGYIDATLVPKSGYTPYALMGNSPVVATSIFLTLTGLIMALSGFRFRKKSSNLSLENRY